MQRSSEYFWTSDRIILIDSTSDNLERSAPAEVDAGLLTAFDNTPVEAAEYE